MLEFVAIDFETANYSRDSACAVGLVKVKAGAIVDRQYRLINPHTRFLPFFTQTIHGIQLDHHQALSDAAACAQILLAAIREGFPVL